MTLKIKKVDINQEHYLLIKKEGLDKEFNPEKKEKKIEKIREVTGENDYLGVVTSYLLAAVLNIDDKASEFFNFFKKDFEKHEHYHIHIPFFILMLEGVTDLCVMDLIGSMEGHLGNSIGYINKFNETKELELIAQTDLSTLIIGETGTSKEGLSRAIHKMSRRRDKKFVGFNCVAVTETLFESELFGYKKGSFTGALPKDKKGLFEDAYGGTFFLDELGKMPEHLQAKLLKVIEEKTIRPLGSTESIPIDVRFIAAAQPKDIDTILPDLKYRLGYPDTIELPPLRERLGLLAPYILEYSTKKVLNDMNDKGKITSISPEAYIKLVNHNYEGNFRELENILRSGIRKAVLNNRNELLGEDVDLSKPEEDVDEKSQKQKTSNSCLSSQLDVSGIQLKDIVDYADGESSKLRAFIVETKVREIINNGDNVKAILKKEGLSAEKDYQNYLKKIKNLMGKSINQIKANKETTER